MEWTRSYRCYTKTDTVGKMIITEQSLEEQFKLFIHPHTQKIIGALKDKSLTPLQLMKETSISHMSLYRKLNALEARGYVYNIRKEHYEDAADWAEQVFWHSKIENCCIGIINGKLFVDIVLKQ